MYLFLLTFEPYGTNYISRFHWLSQNNVEIFLALKVDLSFLSFVDVECLNDSDCFLVSHTIFTHTSDNPLKNKSPWNSYKNDMAPHIHFFCHWYESVDFFDK